ncbi:HEAT repeat domain-containing protein [Halomonas vilamensis]|uniref:HEAT repeat domain-containing protein n=1 Tax=Vreelandella vilamensis TaxID=531309 RepID=A0ABU1H492_9GAMM|nr:HEAT repeat domain-containing protein [Halomonas vilamensis]MDR5898930.1 HEAT repeat domain-containing protein [Halomonas vilamensis]
MSTHETAARASPLKSLPWLVAGLLFESTAAYPWWVAITLPTTEMIALHGVGSVLLAEGLRRALPTPYQRPALGVLLFFALLIFILPAVGFLGLAFGLVPALYRTAPQRASRWQPLDLPALPYQPMVPPSADSVAMREGLTSVLSYSDNSRQRQEAILACRHLPRRQAVSLLRQGLTDPTDDVRLLAYSMLSGIERDLDEQIKTLSTARQDNGDPFGQHAEALAMHYWEYDYLKLAQGSTARFLLNQALDYLDQAIDCADSAHRQLLRGRLCLALNDDQGAKTAFQQCQRLGMHDDDLAPYRAELAFQTRDYASMLTQLARLSPTAREQPILHPLLEYWR